MTGVMETTDAGRTGHWQVGSFCFFMGGLLLYVQMSLREQRAPPLHTALPLTAELSFTLGSDQGSMHGASVRGGSPSHGFDGVNALRF